MQKLTRKSALLSAGAAFAVLGSITGLALAQGQNETETEDAAVGVPAATMVSAINAAAEAKKGDISKVEVEVEAGKTLVDVEVLAKDGKTYEVDVDATSGKVVSVKEKEEEGDTEAMDDKN